MKIHNAVALVTGANRGIGLAFTRELLPAAAGFGPVIDAFTHQHAGKNDYDQGHWGDARDHFARALAIREELELPGNEIESSRIALATADRHLQEDGS